MNTEIILATFTFWFKMGCPSYYLASLIRKRVEKCLWFNNEQTKNLATHIINTPSMKSSNQNVSYVIIKHLWGSHKVLNSCKTQCDKVVEKHKEVQWPNSNIAFFKNFNIDQKTNLALSKLWNMVNFTPCNLAKSKFGQCWMLNIYQNGNLKLKNVGQNCKFGYWVL